MIIERNYWKVISLPKILNLRNLGRKMLSLPAGLQKLILILILILIKKMPIQVSLFKSYISKLHKDNV